MPNIDTGLNGKKEKFKIIFDHKIKSFLKQKMYFHRQVNSKTEYGRRVIITLFAKIKKNPKKYINIKKYDNLNIERIICDYIAGMTDNYLKKEYDKFYK